MTTGRFSTEHCRRARWLCPCVFVFSGKNSTLWLNTRTAAWRRRRRRKLHGGAFSEAFRWFFLPRHTIPPPNNNTAITSPAVPCVGIHRADSSSSSTMVMVRTLTKSSCTISGTSARTIPTCKPYTDRATHYTGCCQNTCDTIVKWNITIYYTKLSDRL